MFIRIRIVALGFLLSALVILFLFYFSQTGTPTGGFSRKYLENKLIKKSEYPILLPSFYLAGNTTYNLYIGSVKYFQGVLELELSTGDTTYYPIDSMVLSPGSHILVDSPIFYVQQQHLSTLLKGEQLPGAVTDTLLQNIFFVDVLAVGKQTLIFRTLSPTVDEFVLSSLRDTIQYHSTILEKQIDGKFCTDGLLRRDALGDRIIYAYYYRNAFICLDTAMNILYRGHTIDTISRARISVSSIRSSNSITLSSPPLIVNKNLQVGADHFYVHSMIPSDNEDNKDQGKYSNLDVYDLRNGSYAFSLRVPYSSGGAMKDYRISNNRLIVAYPGSVVVYLLPSF